MMQASSDRKGVRTAQFSSYISGNNSTPANSWNNCLDSSDSSGSWTQGEGLPPPPRECDQEQQELVIQPKSIPSGPARSWDMEQSDEELSDEGVVERVVSQIQDSDSISDGLDTESECTTEIFIPKLTASSSGMAPVVHQRRSAVQSYSGRGKQHRRRSEVIPSVSSDNIRLTSPEGTLAPTQAPTLTSEDVCTNIDSGISNETSHVHSQQSAVVKARAMSVSSSSHYSSSYSCGSRGEIPSPKLGHQHRLDDITVYMREAKVSRVVSFLSTTYAVLLVLLGVILSVFEVNHGSDSNSYVFEGFYIYLYGLGILFLIYVYATVIKDKKRKDTARKHSSTNHISIGGGAQPMLRQNSADNSDVIPCIGSLFLRIAAVLFCAGSMVDCGLRFGVHIGDDCPLHFQGTAQPVAQAAVMFFEVYFVFNNTKMCIRQYPITAKFGMMHLIATNISIWILNTITEFDNQKKTTTYKYDPLQYQPPSTYNYSSSVSGGDNSGSQVSLLTVLNNNREPDDCTHTNVMAGMALKAHPYTYPCTVQYCIIVTCILYVMWRNVDIDSETQCSDCKEHTLMANLSTTRTIDCSHTSRGLFLGITVLMAAVACLIVFFFMTTEDYYDTKATLIIHIYQIALYLIMTIITVVALLKLRTLDHNACRNSLLEDILVMVCVIALLTHDVVGIVSGILYLNKLKGLLVLATSAAELIQSVVQMAVIVMSLKLCTPDTISTTDSLSQPHLSKPGRECVTFLVVGNIALWAISIFSSVLSQGFDSQLLMMGNISWGFIGVVISPFVMFYHLFSANCFIDIWYNAYRTSSASVVHV